MRILITGANGMLGKEIVKKFFSHELIFGSSHIVPGCVKVDITDKEEIERVLDRWQPNMIINCAAYTAVDAAETDFENAYRVNALGPKYLAECAEKRKLRLVHFSTDYVFDGTKKYGQFYDENDFPNPLSVYGKTKREGEIYVESICKKHYIFRTSWLFGDGKNFVKTITNLVKAKPDRTLSIIADQWGSPTYTADLATIVYQAVIDKKIPFGIYNATNMGIINWFQFASLFLNKQGLECNLNMITTEEYSADAARPKNSCLNKNKLLQYGIEIPYFEDALDIYLRKEEMNG